MPFDWIRAIAKNRDNLIEVVTQLFVLAGIRTGHSVTLLPRGLRIRLLALLRPAEFAARRLILMAACRLEWEVGPQQRRRNPTPKVGTAELTDGTQQGPVSDEPSGEELTDGTQQGPVSDEPSGEELTDGTQQGPVSDEPSGEELTDGTEKPSFALFDPFKPFRHPWLEEGDDGDGGAGWPAPEPDPDEPVDVRAVCRRIVALEAALQDIEGQARRLARWRARRHLETARPRRWSALRPGLPPGWRRRPKTRVEAVLKECHALALYAVNGPDTS